MDLTQNGAVVTGTWSERTNPDGLPGIGLPRGYPVPGRSDRSPAPRQWVGYGRDFDLNTGPWTLELVSSDTSTEAMERFQPATRISTKLRWLNTYILDSLSKVI